MYCQIDVQEVKIGFCLLGNVLKPRCLENGFWDVVRKGSMDWKGE
jgi:hypothetical protein